MHAHTAIGEAGSDPFTDGIDTLSSLVKATKFAGAAGLALSLFPSFPIRTGVTPLTRGISISALLD